MAIHRNYEYPHPSGEGSVAVEILTRKRALDSVPKILDVIRAGYEIQFEHGEPPRLQPGSVANLYITDAMNIQRYTTRTDGHYDRAGSKIVVVHAPNGGFEAFAKVTPAPAATGGECEGVYLNDVIASNHRRGMGSTALHAALTKTGFSPDSPLVLEAYEDSPVNEWYQRLLLEPLEGAPPADDHDFGSGQIIPMMYYSTPDGVGIGDVVAVLEASHPQLAHAHPV